MRKPAVVVALILALTFSITLARRLAQPAITGQQEATSGAGEASVAEIPSQAESPRVAPTPIRPSLAQVAPIAAKEPSSRAKEPSSRAKEPSSRAKEPSSRAKRGILSSPAQHQDTRYEAMLASPERVYSRVKDYGAHGIGSPKWIESLSGAKARVPVRDFSGETARNDGSHIEPLAVPVDSQVELAH